MTFEKRHRVRKQAAQISGGGACQEGKGLGQECSRDGKESSVTGVERGPRAPIMCNLADHDES